MILFIALIAGLEWMEKTMTTNAEWMIKNGYKFSDLTVRYLNAAERNKFVVRYKDEKVGAFELDEELVFNDYAYKKWLDTEHVDPILDDAEKRYLNGVIMPFRSRIIWIKKAYRSGNYEQIIIRMKSIVPYALLVDIQFPLFKEKEMYKGMNLGKEYTLEELGL